MPSQPSQDGPGRGAASHLPSAVLFGPQVTQWTPEAIRGLQESLQQNRRLRFLADTLAGIPQALQAPLNKLLGPNAPTVDALRMLSDLATGAGPPDASDFTTVHLSTLTVVCHAVDFARRVEEEHGARHPGRLEEEKEEDELELPGEIAAVQGFCMGFLTAAAVAVSATWAEFEAAMRCSLHLAVCIGAIVDGAEKRDGLGRGHAAHSVKWKTDADRANLEVLVDGIPDAYISCTTDERTWTVTLPTVSEDAFYTRIGREAGIVAKPIGLRGCFHHDSKHAGAARVLKDLCSADAQLQLPTADRLRLPLRSPADGELLRHGTLHDAAIDTILMRRAHWFQTVRNTLRDDLPAGAEIRSVPLGQPSAMPRSLQQQPRGGKASSTRPAEGGGEEEVAIVGMACRFPRADSLLEFWELIRTGGTALSRVPSARFDHAQVAREPRTESYWGNFLRHPDAFDHRFFGISGREAKSMDPQQRLALQVAYEALESSAYFSASSSRSVGGDLKKRNATADVGCYLGVGSVDYEDNVASERANAFSATGTLRAFISGRISHHFGWSGPSITFDTACSSSAVAIHSACQAILSGDCSLALAGGVNVITSPTLYQNLAAASFLSPTGSSKAFDASADGYCRGEGCGMLLLKPLSRAVTDGDDILGVISGTAVNQGSNCSPITVPHSESQRSLYTKALELGGIDPAEVTYVEAHGTGTPVGDPIEFESVRSTFSRPGRKEDLFLGSIKDNIGHTEGASGVAGVIKAVLMMQRKTIPKQANFRTLSPRITCTPADRIIVPTATRPWTVRGQTGRRVALVNNYGAAGSNAAIVIREHAPPTETNAAATAAPQRCCCYPILLSAKTPRSLRAYAAALRTRLKAAAAAAPDAADGGLPPPCARDVAHSVARTHNVAFEVRAAVKAETMDELLRELDEVAAAADDYSSGPLRLRPVPAQRPAVVLCFGGQTGRPVTLSKTLFDSCALLRGYLNKCDDVCKTLGLPGLFPTILQREEEEAVEKVAEEDLVLHHCLLFSLQYSTAKCWLDSGLEVDTLVGHSFGQLTALCISQSISLEDAIRLIAGRAQLIQTRWGPERGAMLAVEGEMPEIQAVLEAAANQDGVEAAVVEIACYNGPGSVVVAGDTSSIDRLEELFGRAGEPRRFKTARLKNSHAYHSRFADPILAELEKLAQDIVFKEPLIRIETCSPGEPWTHRIGAREIVQHSRQPVHFYDAVQRVVARLPRAIWVEAGSNSAIMPMAQRILSSRPDAAANHVLIPLDLGTRDKTARSVASAACRLWMEGSMAQPWQLDVSQQRGTAAASNNSCWCTPLDMPPYQFEQSSHWIRTLASERAKTDNKTTPATTQPCRSLVTPVIKKDSPTSEAEALFAVDTAHPLFDLATRGHAVAGQSLCPASMYLELAARCAGLLVVGEEEGEEEEEEASRRRQVPHVEDLVMSSPLGLATDRQVYVRLSGHADASDLFDFAVFSSQPRGGEETTHEAQQHARGRIRLCAPRDPAMAARIAVLKRVARGGVPSARIAGAAGSTSVSGPLVYKLFGDVVEYAPYYRGVRRVAGCEREAAGRVVLPADRSLSGLEPGVFDPVLLDNFLQVAGIHVNCLSERAPTEVFLCTAVEEVVFSQPFLQTCRLARSWDVYSRYETVGKGEVVNDVFVFDSSSAQLVLAIMGAVFKSVAFKSLERSLTRLNIKTTRPDDDDSGYASPNVPTESGVVLPPSGVGKPETRQHCPDAAAMSRAKQPSTQSRIEKEVRTLFSEIIEIPVGEVQPSSTFDDLGIDSLLVTEVLSEIKKSFGVHMTPGEFQECNDVAGLCRRIDPGSTEDNSNHLYQTTAAPPSPSDVNEASSNVPRSLHSDDGAPPSLNGYGDHQGDRSGFASMCQDAFATVKTGFDEHAKTTGFVGFCDGAHALQSQLVVRYVVEAFTALGCDLATLDAGDQVPIVRHVAQHSKLVPQLYRILEDAGLIEAAGGDEPTKQEFRRTRAAVPTTSSSQLHAHMLERYPQHEAETKLLHTTGPRLADCLTGTADPLALLFRDAKARALLEEVYTNAPMFRAGTMLLADYLCSVADRVEEAAGRELRILELGAGTGGTSKHLVTRLAERNRRPFTYTFTDLSPSLVAAAKRKFAGHAAAAHMRYAVLDVEKPPQPPHVAAYDIVLSTNCIHATRDLVISTSHIRRMLRPDGVLCLVELTRNLFWFDLVFGLLEGWWLFDDGRGHALADEARWRRCLRAAGFRWVDWSEGASRESAVLRVITASAVPAVLEPEPESMGSPRMTQIEKAAANGTGYEDDKECRGKLQQDTRGPRVRVEGQSGTTSPSLLLSKETVVFKKLAADGLELQADIYYPAHQADPARPLPVALMIHGGGHIMLSRDDIRPQQTDLLLRHGFLPVSIDYRLCPEITLPDGPLTDVADALAWARTELPGLGLQRRDVRADGSRVVAVGWSTGGMLALSLGWRPPAERRGVRPADGVLAFYCPTDYEDDFWTRPNRPAGSESAAARYADYQLDDATWADGLFDQPVTRYQVAAAAPRPDGQGQGKRVAIGGWLAPDDARSRVALYMNWHGRSLDVLLRGLDKTKRKRGAEAEPVQLQAQPPTADMVRAVSPLARVRGGDHVAPVFMVHPVADDLIPWQQAARTHEAMRECGVRAELRLVGGGAAHLFDVYRGWEANEGARRAVEDGYAFLCECVGLEARGELER